jgi:hypothetical protein
MYKPVRQCVALCVAGLLVSAQALPTNPTGVAYAQDQKIPVDEALKKSYLELFEYAEVPQYAAAELKSVREGLKRAGEICVSRFKEKSKQYGREIEQAQKQLKDKGGKITETERHDLHCRIQNLRALQSQTEVLAKHAIPIAYENRKAKLDLIEQWPAKFKEISKQLEDGTYRNRRWGDVEDIGFREIE